MLLPRLRGRSRTTKSEVCTPRSDKRVLKTKARPPPSKQNKPKQKFKKKNNKKTRKLHQKGEKDRKKKKGRNNPKDLLTGLSQDYVRGSAKEEFVPPPLAQSFRKQANKQKSVKTSKSNQSSSLCRAQGAALMFSICRRGLLWDFWLEKEQGAGQKRIKREKFPRGFRSYCTFLSPDAIFNPAVTIFTHVSVFHSLNSVPTQAGLRLPPSPTSPPPPRFSLQRFHFISGCTFGSL